MTSPNPEPTPATEVPPVGTEAPLAATPDTPPGGETLSPEALRKELTEARGEAASYRTQLRDAQAKLAAAKTPEEFQAAVQGFNEQMLAKDREIVAVRHNLPEALAARLQGSTPEELEADAKALAALVTPQAPAAPPAPAPSNLSEGPAGGRTPGHINAEPSDPGALARQYGGRR